MIFLIQTALAGGIVLAAAQSMPTFNVDPSCRGPARAGSQANSVATCRETERKAREEIAKQWARVSAADKATCVPMSSLGGAPTDTELLTCIELTREARRLRDRESLPSSANTTEPTTTGNGGGR